nr:hypothetical protein Itr_chr07CG19420 [Ipomoea trifida]GMD13725.1 hypothetical protein Iba_chr07aCG15770 [Ipomoea batatas]
MNLSNAITDEEESKIFGDFLELGDSFLYDKSECQNATGAPSNKCATQIAKIIKQDGRTLTKELPTKQCCSELLSWGENCYYHWMNYELGHLPKDIDLFQTSAQVLVNIGTVWIGCQSNKVP